MCGAGEGGMPYGQVNWDYLLLDPPRTVQIFLHGLGEVIYYRGHIAQGPAIVAAGEATLLAKRCSISQSYARSGSGYDSEENHFDSELMWIC